MLASKQGEERLRKEYHEKFLGIIDVISNYNLRLGIDQFLAIATSIQVHLSHQPRYYTIASSAKVNPRLVSVTASIVYTEVGTEKKVGLTSAYFKRIEQAFISGQTVSVRMDFLNSTFHLPTATNTEVRSHDEVHFRVDRRRLCATRGHVGGERDPG